MGSSQVTTRGDRRAFTLIELLTVIAIIGILAAILIPVVGSVRHAAREVKSLSNLRQIGLALNLYADDHNDYFPPGYYYVPGDAERIWHVEILSYVGLEVFTHRADESLFVSPLAEIPVRDAPPGGTVMPFTYSAHGVLLSNTSSEDNRLARDHVERPTEVILVAEATQRSGNTYANATFGNPSAFRTRGVSADLDELIPTDTDVDGVGGSLRYRGRNAAPAVFVDGHVEALKKGTVKYRHIVADR